MKNSKQIKLKGITWNHSRGYCPMVATAQRFSETHPNIIIEWSKRSLQGFADEHLDKLVQEYDLLIIDHPWAGYLADNDILLALNHYLPKTYLEDQRNNSVGKSHESYNFEGNQYALAIDAATPVASSRPDLIQEKNLSIPKTFNDVLDLAAKGFVIMPGIPIDTLMNFYMMCCVLGEDPFLSENHVIGEKVGIKALESLKKIANLLPQDFYKWNPIKVYEIMSSTDDFAYCPWAYGYVNYSKKGYAEKQLQYHNLIVDTNNNLFRSTLGGTGLSISANCKYIDIASEYAMFVANPTTQKNLYFDNGGQPGHLKAWQNSYTNNNSINFFKSTLSSLNNAFLRPRYNGYLFFQDVAGDIIQDFLRFGGKPINVLTKLNELYLKTNNII